MRLESDLGKRVEREEADLLRVVPGLERSPGDVAAEVRSRLDTIGRDGGLIIGPTHHVQLDTPLENFWAMVDAVKRLPGG